jgi:hypothetical protein
MWVDMVPGGSVQDMWTADQSSTVLLVTNIKTADQDELVWGDY